MLIGELANAVGLPSQTIRFYERKGGELDMGTPVNATPEDSNGTCYFDAAVSVEARSNRTVMAKALEEVGLVNYPTEWWHWSYGDRYWLFTIEGVVGV